MYLLHLAYSWNLIRMLCTSRAIAYSLVAYDH